MKKQEVDAGYYDEMYQTGGWNGNYFKHYSCSPYLKSWEKLLLFIGSLEDKKILDIGCGVGQFASFLKDNGLKHYCSIDFSQESIRQARQKRLKNFIFKKEDIFHSDLLDQSFDYVVILEVLEHLEEDLKLLSLFKPKTKMIISVPNYDFASHVRYFESLDSVILRYRKLINFYQSASIEINQGAGIIFLLEGERV
ncbi:MULTISPECIES: class I SAM-dependent methyltransferase [unclassified Helicobacter]|uniref:class I SAM-dependent methyltransferase n=1 Tax=unclassified Helicobacter TaxID=2593540 RepID=UPI000CF14E53|nr:MULTISPECIES: class I SAM-dependent methyltransferase [unclassified Helicobacter]